MAAPLTPLDELYRHQLVAPAATVEHQKDSWAERCYHLLNLGGGMVLNAGRAVYANAGRRSGFVGFTDGRTQHCLRVAEPFAIGQDPDDPSIGPLRIEAVRPLKEVKISLAKETFPVALDLTWTARFPPVATDPNRIERDGQVLTHYMNFFQSGVYSGTVAVEGREMTVSGRAGFRDRGWGLRKHEGAPKRGLVVFCGCELQAQSLYVLLYETASGKRVFTNGWLIGDEGTIDTVTGAEHDLSFAGTLLEAGALQVSFASGRVETLTFEVTGRLHLSGVGYTADESRALPGVDRFDLTNRDVVAELDGQNDNACDFRFAGGSGHGYVETGLGAHARYRSGQR